MEYYIGFNRFDSSVKKKVIACFVIMFVSCAGMIFALVRRPKQPWYLVSATICVVVAFVLFRIDAKEQRNHLDQYTEAHKKKLFILEDVLDKTLGISTKEKMEELICLYQKYVDKKNEEEKARNRIIAIILSAFASVLTISFNNMGVIGVDFEGWIYLALVLLLIVGVASLWLYMNKYFETLKGEYETMIKDIQDLILMKF